ncbi:MAG: hypothetical protein HYZ58_19730 [Acidobacteria bacterium]|nr:hypothetical protein [Acidobacteriota bacterium]
MRLPRLIPILVVIGVIGASAPAGFVTATPVREVAVVNIAGPVEVQRMLLNGPYVFEHDTARMARGEPCTAIYEFSPNGLGRKVLSFHCLPRESGTVEHFTMRVQRSFEMPAPRLTEYQFAGSGEAHGVPRR